MPKSKYPESVQDLPDDKYDQWTAVYHSARDDGDSKETAAKKAWGAVNESKYIKITKADLKEMVRTVVRKQLLEASQVDTRMDQLHRIKIENDVTLVDLLEDILEQMDDGTWKTVIDGVRHKYGYRK